MESLSQSLYDVVSEAIHEFAELAASKFELDKDELLEVWNSKVSSSLNAKGKKSAEKKTVTKKSVAAKSSSSDLATCAYEFKKGANAGTKCTTKVRSEDSMYCNKHNKNKTQEGKENEEKPKPKAKAKQGKKKGSSESKENETPAIQKMNEGKRKLAISKNKHGNYEHVETHLVLDKNTKEVYGKQSEDGKVLPLTAEDIENCKSMGFKYRMPTNITSKKERDQELEDDNDTKDNDEDEEDEEDDDDGDDDDDDDE